MRRCEPRPLLTCAPAHAPSDGRVRAGSTLEHGERAAKLEIGEAIRRGEFTPCDPCRSSEPQPVHYRAEEGGRPPTRRGTERTHSASARAGAETISRRAEVG